MCLGVFRILGSSRCEHKDLHAAYNRAWDMDGFTWHGGSGVVDKPYRQNPLPGSYIL